MAIVEFTFFNETELPLPLNEQQAQRIAEAVLKGESRSALFIEVVFVDDDEILRINLEHLQHDYVTDIITFPYHDEGEEIEGTLFCCAPQIFRQADEESIEHGTEFARILIHGILHLCGYEDGQPEQKARMTAKENYYLNQFQITE